MSRSAPLPMIGARPLWLAAVATWWALTSLLWILSGVGIAIDMALAMATGLTSLGIALVSVWPLRSGQRASLERQSTGVVGAVAASLAMRSSLTIFFIILMVKWEWAPRQAAGLWGIFWYASLWLAECLVVARHVTRYGQVPYQDAPALTGHVTEINS